MEEYHFWGSGWSFPPAFHAGNKQLALQEKEENINQSIEVVLKTMQGERNFYPQFGSGLGKFLFRDMNETLSGEIREEVKQTLVRNEPRISLNEVRVNFSKKQQGYAEIEILYTVRKTNTRHNHVFPFSLREGTNLYKRI